MKDRKIVQWLIAYLAGAWVALELTDMLREIWDWPLSLPQAISLVLGLGVLPAAVIAWYHGEKGRQEVCPLEVVLLGGLVLGGAAFIWCVCR